VADEILELGRHRIGEHSDGTDRLRFRVLFVYELDPPIATHSGVAYALTSRGNLPPEVSRYRLLTDDEMEKFEVGTSAFWEEPVDQKKDESLGDALARVRRLYVKRQRFITVARVTYANMGRRHDA
jgi:hypothetical protein